MQRLYLFCHLLIDLSPRTDDRLRYWTNSGKIPSKFYVPNNLKHLKHLDDEHTKSLYSPSIPTLFPRTQNSVSKNLSKRNYPISQRVHRQPTARKLVRSKKKSRAKVQRQNSRTVFKKNILEATQEVYFRRQKDDCSFINQFPPKSLIICLEMENFVLVPRCPSTTASRTQPLLENKNYPNIDLSEIPRTRKPERHNEKGK